MLIQLWDYWTSLKIPRGRCYASGYPVNRVADDESDTANCPVPRRPPPATGQSGVLPTVDEPVNIASTGSYRIERSGRRSALSHHNSGGTAMQTLWQDLRFAVRMLKKNLGFAVVAVLTLALGIGANAVVFSVLNALILHPLRVPDAESLYGIHHGNEASSYQSYPDYIDMRDRNRSFDGLAGYDAAQVGLDTGENAARAWIALVSGNYFGVLRLQPFLGRFFHGSDHNGPNSAPYIVLSYDYWHTHFQDDRGVVGRIVQVNKHPFTIIGVAPA